MGNDSLDITQQYLKKNATYEDLYKIPESMIGQIINNKLVVTPRPSYRHASVTSDLGAEIIPPYKFGRGGPGGWIILYEPEIKLGENIFVPDLAGWKKEKLLKLPATNYISISPDWICEVLSPSTEKTDRARKMPIYAQFGVSYFWIIDPIEKVLEIFKLSGNQWIVVGTYAEDDKVKPEPFQEIEIDLKNLWLD
ncbi:MAG: Uma2 family endonuclease [Desulfobacterales bacterium]|nr:Uma2 family endonuclease [Desulfobacterales bacterium]